MRDANVSGSRISMQDLTSYAATTHEAMSMTYASATVYAAPGLTAGPTMFDTLSRIDGKIAFENGSPSAESYALYASALRAAYETRLATMGDANDAQDPACTTHLTTIDGGGNMVTLTQTLLSAFGSKVVLPETGILMNNGIMWFDTRPGGPNSSAAANAPLQYVPYNRASGRRFQLRPRCIRRPPHHAGCHAEYFPDGGRRSLLIRAIHHAHRRQRR